MKDEEMAEQFADNINGLDLTCSLLSAKDKSHAYRLGRYDGFLAGLKAGRPQWHKVADGDLPENTISVLVSRGGNRTDRARYSLGKWYGYYDDDEMEGVIAWCEIPTFDKE